MLLVLVAVALQGAPLASTAVAFAAGPTWCPCSCPCPCPQPCLQLLYPPSTVPLAEVVVAAAQAWQDLQPQERGVYAGRQAQVGQA